MHPEKFESRIKYLNEKKYNISSLSNAIQLIKYGNIPKNTVVITFDDGWYGIYRYARPILKKYHIPYTVYIYSYYSQSQDPVYNVLMDYLYYIGSNIECAIEYLSSCVGIVKIEKLNAYDQYKKLTETMLNVMPSSEQRKIVRHLADALEVSWAAIEKERRFHLMSASEIGELANEGVDIQLHTHRHEWPSSRSSALNEIRENRAYLEPLVGRKLSHFCYPSGSWSPRQLPFLREAGIESAVTCDAGGNDRSSNVLALSRFLDGQHISKTEFEAEVTGLSDLFRKCRSLLHPPGVSTGPAQPHPF